MPALSFYRSRGLSDLGSLPALKARLTTKAVSPTMMTELSVATIAASSASS